MIKQVDGVVERSRQWVAGRVAFSGPEAIHMHFVDDQFVQAFGHWPAPIVFGRPEGRVVQRLRRRKGVIVDVAAHAFWIDDHRAAFCSVEILAGMIPGGLAIARILRLFLPGTDLAARIEVSPISDGAVVFANAKHIELVIPAREIRERGIFGIALPDAAAVSSFCQLEGVLCATSIAPDVSSRGIANDGIDRARVWSPNGKHQGWISCALAPKLVGAEAAAGGEPIALDLTVRAEFETTLLHA